MNRDQIIRIFHKAGEAAGWKPDVSALLLNYIMHFAPLVAAAEREECARVCEEADIVEFEHCMVLHQDAAKTLTNAAAAIRARGNV